MKTMRLLFTLLFVAAFATVGFGQITGSAHDFRSETWHSGAGAEICIVCHTPHNSDITIPEAPLWNHDNTGATFQPYSGTTLNAAVGQPTGESLLCLSCHDGSVALDSYGGSSGTNFLVLTDDAFVGIDLRDDHPISFTYDDALATSDGGLHAPTATASGLAGGGTITTDLLYSGVMQCSSCHDVHRTVGIPSLLRIDNAGSALCLTCHDK